jgi:hypothetical protein
MDVQKLELLLKKINQAIKTIQILKDKDKQNTLEIKLLKEENTVLKTENDSLKMEIQKNNLIHNELENKITEILKYLPEDDETEQKNSAVTFNDDNNEQVAIDTVNKVNVQADTGKLETEEDMLKEFVKEQKSTNSLFNSDANNFPGMAVDEDMTETESTVEKENLSFEEKIENKFEMDFNEELFDKNTDSIEFNFEDRQNDDLPKGVL